MPGPETTAAAVRDLTVEYLLPSGPVTALSEVHARFPAGCLSVLSGPSGSGKSTLLRCLAGLQAVRSGAVEIDGVDLVGMSPRARRRLRRRRLGVVLQDPADNLIADLRAHEQVVLAARLRGTGPDEADDLLAAVDLADRRRALPAELSGGEQQRVAFAAGAVGHPAVLLADEPTAQLDAAAGTALVAVMRTLVDRGMTLVVASHDPHVVDAADHVVALRDGRSAP